jgi:hypothetical protein
MWLCLSCSAKGTYIIINERIEEADGVPSGYQFRSNSAQGKGKQPKPTICNMLPRSGAGLAWPPGGLADPMGVRRADGEAAWTPRPPAGN